MPKDTQATEIRHFIVRQVGLHSRDIASLVAKTFRISRQAANKHLRRLVDQRVLSAKGATRNREYSLRILGRKSVRLPLSSQLEEHEVWRQAAMPVIGELKGSAIEICHYAFTEMVNNAIDHSRGSELSINVEYTAGSIRFTVSDNGIGIFRKLKDELGLNHEREAILELSKGKVTTDPKRHSGEGIFFTSRAMDDFMIVSGSLAFAHQTSGDDWLLEGIGESIKGTTIDMLIDPMSSRKLLDVFHAYSAEDHEGFTKTHFPVVLAKVGEESLVSRSQAKRVLARIERFREVILDFSGIETIGQAFADEVFRVFQHQHPDVHLIAVNANEDVARMISRAQKALRVIDE
jgi:anti-sigma regulatory factor (Ser/Thr protein kinase)